MNLQQEFNSFLKALQASSSASIRIFVENAEKIVSTYKSVESYYKQGVLDLSYLFALGHVLQTPAAKEIERICEERKIPLQQISKYLVLSIYILPLIAAIKAKKQKVSDHIIASLKTLHQQRIVLSKDLTDYTRKFPTKSVVEGVVFVSEGWFRDLLGRIGRAFVNGLKKIAFVLGDIASSLISLYNDIFSLINLSINKLASKIPGGRLLVSFGIPAFFRFVSTPPLVLLSSIHSTLTSPILEKGTNFYRLWRSGKLMSTLDQMFSTLEKEIDWSDIDPILDTLV